MTSTQNTLKTGSFDLLPKAGVVGVMLAVLAGTTGAFAQSSKQSEHATKSASAQQASSGLASFAQPAKQGEPAPQGEENGLTVSDDMTVDLHVKDEDLATVLEMLSIQSQKNIIASKDVSARVTANLYGVTFYEALDAILNVNGYGFVEEGNFIKIYTREELEKVEQAARQKVSKVIPLNYLNAVDAAEFVKPLLSPEGQIKVNGKAAPFAAASDTPVGGEDYANNSMLVIYDYEENVAQVDEMVRQVDTRPAQVLVEATILQTQLNEANALGVDFSLVSDVSFSDFVGSGPLGAATAVITGKGKNITGADTAIGNASAVTSSVGGTASGAGGLKIGVVSNDVGVFLRALDEVTDTTVLSNPKIMTLNRQASRVLVGRKVGYLSTTSTDTATTQSVEFLDTGTQLYFRPFVTHDGLIRMELRPAVSEAAIRTVSDVSGAAITIPDEITNELTTNVIVKDGQTIVLGGLFREKIESSRKQVPLLGDIPFIGQAFQGNTDDVNRNEIIFLITPTILNDSLLADSGDRGKNYVDSIVAGSRDGLLFFSRDRLTNNLNVEAERALRDGNQNKALNKIERSLQLNPRQPELITKREKITGQKTPETNRSFLDRVINHEADDSLIQSDAASGPLSSATPWQQGESNEVAVAPQMHQQVAQQPAVQQPAFVQPQQDASQQYAMEGDTQVENYSAPQDAQSHESTYDDTFAVIDNGMEQVVDPQAVEGQQDQQVASEEPVYSNDAIQSMPTQATNTQAPTTQVATQEPVAQPYTQPVTNFQTPASKAATPFSNGSSLQNYLRMMALKNQKAKQANKVQEPAQTFTNVTSNENDGH